MCSRLEGIKRVISGSLISQFRDNMPLSKLGMVNFSCMIVNRNLGPLFVSLLLGSNWRRLRGGSRLAGRYLLSSLRIGIRDDGQAYLLFLYKLVHFFF